MILIPHRAELRLVGWISWLITCQGKRFRDFTCQGKRFRDFITRLLERSAEQFRFKTRVICEVWRNSTWRIFTSDRGKPAEITSAKHIFRVCKAETQTSRTRCSFKGTLRYYCTFQSTSCLTLLQYGYFKKKHIFRENIALSQLVGCINSG